MEVEDLSVTRAAQNQALFGEISDDLRALGEKVGGVVAIDEFVCECVDADCRDRIALTLEEYELVRALPARYAMRPGHVHESDRVISQHDHYVVIEKRRHPPI
jgi:hypothetical protein